MVEKREYKKADRSEKYEDDMDDGMDDGRKGRRFSGGGRKKPCRFMAGEEEISNISYKTTQH